ncbi:diacylglycerol kinase [Helicobacter sp. 16-1353]|uniref:diacylglycerol kinase n=1 Tax=Helicobacter sp. 16-1353 TaxID=2004996 RepID=UPI000DCD03D2|nr:diacylglycerol kinase [Helicobacter sp. 16-1353]RAX52050.1 diacylglycerol kinase [Helicobacter sp. 16-1353]
MKNNNKKQHKVNRNSKKGKKGLSRIYNALFYSLDGIKAAWVDEVAFRQIAVMAVIFIPIGIFLGESWIEKILLVLPCVLCLVVELINSAIENIVDLISLEINPLAKKAKDMGSAMQFIMCLFFVFVWISYVVCKYILL